MKINQIILGLFLLTSIQLIAQDTIQINFDARYHIVDKQSHGFMTLIDNHTNSFQYDDKSYEVEFPDNFIVSDTAIALNYFTGWANPAIEDNTAFLFGNYRSHTPIVYVDYNHNLDFSDDGQPLQFGLDSTLVVYIRNSKLPTAYFPIKFFYPNIPADKKDAIAAFLLDDPDEIGKTIASVDYWLADQRMNYKVMDTWLNGKSIKIGLYDYDCNGIFNDIGEDRIMVGDYKENYISGQLKNGAIAYTDKVQIPIANEVYEVVDIEFTGKYMRLVKSTNPYYKPLGLGDYVGDLELDLVSGHSATISDLLKEKDYLILDFWATWCKPCVQEIPNLKHLIGQVENLQIIGINDGEDISTINSFIKKQDIPWINGMANQEIKEKLRVEGLPRHLLIDKKGNIVMMSGTVKELDKFISDISKH